jgi:hypothetical protein
MENKSVVSKILSGYKIPDKTVPDKTGQTVLHTGSFSNFTKLNVNNSVSMTSISICREFKRFLSE